MLFDGREVANVEAYVAAGATHLIQGMGPSGPQSGMAGPPFDLDPLRALLEAAGKVGDGAAGPG